MHIKTVIRFDILIFIYTFLCFCLFHSLSLSLRERLGELMEKKKKETDGAWRQDKKEMSQAL